MYGYRPNNKLLTNGGFASHVEYTLTVYLHKKRCKNGNLIGLTKFEIRKNNQGITNEILKNEIVGISNGFTTLYNFDNNFNTMEELDTRARILRIFIGFFYTNGSRLQYLKLQFSNFI